MFDGPWESCMFVHGLTPSECASWVQAWGSIAAIAAGAIGILYQIRKQASAVRQLENERAAILAGALFQFRCQLIQLLSGAAKGGLMLEHITSVRRYVRSFNDVGLHDLPSAMVQSTFASVMTEADMLEDAMAAAGGAPDHQEGLRWCINAATTLIDRIENAEFAFESYLNHRGAFSPSQGFHFEGVNYHPAGRKMPD